MNRSLACWLVAAIGAVAAAAPAARAGLSYVSQERLVYAGAGDFPTRSTAALGRFSADLSGESVNQYRDHMGAHASQTSVLGDTSIVASGGVGGDSSNDLVSYRALLRATFDIAAGTPYRLSSSIDFPLYHPDGNLDTTTNGDPVYALALRRVGPSGGSDTLIDVRRDQGELLVDPAGHRVSVDRAGTLSAGRYELRLNVQSQFNLDSEDGTYKLAFTTGGGSGGNGGGPTAVPLPPAAWAGLLTLAGLAAARAWAARRARRE